MIPSGRGQLEDSKPGLPGVVRSDQVFDQEFVWLNCMACRRRSRGKASTPGWEP